MRKVILTMQMSLDGIVSDVEQWMKMSDEIMEDSLGYYHTLGAIVVGGHSYTSLAEYWQNVEKTSGSTLERAFAKRINEIRKFVISRSKVDLVWNNSEQLPVNDRESLVREIENLKKSKGKKISVESGAKTWQLFIQNALFDEIWLFIHPLVVARGEKLFADNEIKYLMRLYNSKIYRNGVVGLYYQKL